MPVHASAVAFPELGGVLILGKSGSGKSSLAYRWITRYGAILISDDQVKLTQQGGEWLLSAPESIQGRLMIGTGEYRLPFVPQAPLRHLVCTDAALTVWQYRTHAFPLTPLFDFETRFKD